MMRPVPVTAGRLAASAVLMAVLTVATYAVPAAPVPVGRRGQEVAGAKALVSRLTRVKQMSELPALMTNESAGTMGAMVGAIVYMIAGFADGMASMGSSTPGTAQGAPGATAKPRVDPQVEKLKALRNETAAVFQRYGVNVQGSMQSAPPPQLMRNGRRFFGDVLAVFNKLPQAKSRAGMGEHIRRSFKGDPRKLKYKVLSPTRVAITGMDDKGNPQRLEARVEDGAWRLHVPELAQIFTRAMSSQPMRAGQPHRMPRQPVR